MKYLLFFLILLIVLIDCNIIYEDKIPYMTILEIIEFNIKLYLIMISGIVYNNKIGCYILEFLTNDKLLLNFYNKLQKKYNNIVITFIITFSKHYFILNENMSKYILNNSPKLFGPGYIKEDSFNKFMPNNVGISKCNENKCPWKKRRIFNENVLGTKYYNYYLKILPNIIFNNLNKPLLNINDFKNKGFQLSSILIYGINKENIIKDFIIKFGIKEKHFKNEKLFYEKYKKSLKNFTKNSLLQLCKKYKNDNNNIINDQIPHFFGPFTFIISFLIPNLMCIILNFKNIYNKILLEINNEKFNIFSKNTYLHYCIIEHIRLFNTININMPRTSNQSINFNDFNFKTNEQIFILFSSLLRNEKLFIKPNEYIPNRWENKSLEEQNIVFGIGPQQCPSIQITPLLYKSIIYKLLKKYKYKNIYPKLKSKEIYFINPYKINFELIK